MSDTAVADAPATTTLLTDDATSAEAPTTPTPDAPAADAAAPTDAPVAPVYEFVAPEGVTYDTALLEKVTPFLAKANVPAEVAQEMVSTYAAHVAEQTAAALQAADEAFASQVKGWADETRADPEIGGANLKASIAASQRVLAQFGDASTQTLLNQSGLGNHPAMVKLLAKIGAAITEDTTIRGASGGAPAPTSAVDKLYPTMRKES